MKARCTTSVNEVRSCNATCCAGAGPPAKDGQYVVKLIGDQTEGLGVGACEIVVRVVSTVVGMPTFASFSLVVTK